MGINHRRVRKEMHRAAATKRQEEMRTLQEESTRNGLHLWAAQALLDLSMSVDEPETQTPRATDHETLRLKAGHNRSDDDKFFSSPTSPLPPSSGFSAAPSGICLQPNRDPFTQALPILPMPVSDMNSMGRTVQSQSDPDSHLPTSTPGSQVLGGFLGTDIYKPRSVRRCEGRMELDQGVQSCAVGDFQSERSFDASQPLPYSAQHPHPLSIIRKTSPHTSPYFIPRHSLRGPFREQPNDLLVPQSSIPCHSLGTLHATGHYSITRLIYKILQTEYFLPSGFSFDGVSYLVSWQPSVIPESTYRLLERVIKSHCSRTVQMRNRRGMKRKIYWQDDWVSFSGAKKIEMENLLKTGIDNNDSLTILCRKFNAEDLEWLSTLFNQTSRLQQSVRTNSVLQNLSHARVQAWLSSLINLPSFEQGETANLPSPSQFSRSQSSRSQSSRSQSIICITSQGSPNPQTGALPPRSRGGSLSSGKSPIDKLDAPTSLHEQSRNPQGQDYGIQDMDDFSKTFRSFRFSKSTSPPLCNTDGSNTTSPQQAITQSAPACPTSVWPCPIDSSVKIRHRYPERSSSTDLDVNTASIYPGSLWQLTDLKPQSFTRDLDPNCAADIKTCPVFPNWSSDTHPVINMPSPNIPSRVIAHPDAKAHEGGDGKLRVYGRSISISGSDSEIINDFLRSSEIYKSYTTRRKRKFESTLFESPPDGGLQKRLKVVKAEGVPHMILKPEIERPSNKKNPAMVIELRSDGSCEVVKARVRRRSVPEMNNAGERICEVAMWVNGIKQHHAPV